MSVAPHLAVVVLSVGAPAVLTRALRSLLDQDVPLEIVVVNSGGGDAGACLPEGGDRIRVITFNDRLKPGAARNRGIAASSAPFVAFLASDCIAAEGWAAARLARHDRGFAAVGSAIGNTQAGRAAAVSHVLNFGPRDRRAGPGRELQYGGSYARWIFDLYGVFREDMRVGEDTEFNQRLEPEDRPCWAPEILTIHDNPATLPALLTDQYQRGRRLGIHWPSAAGWAGRLGGARRRAGKARARWKVIHGRAAGRLATLLLVLAAIAFLAGFRAGHRRAVPGAEMETRALGAAGLRQWAKAANAWDKAALEVPPAHPMQLNRAVAHWRAGRVDTARQVIAAARQAAPDDLTFAVAGARLEEDERAMVAWRALAAESGEREIVMRGLARTLVRNGAFDEAAGLLERLLAHEAYRPDSERALAEIALLRADWVEVFERQKDFWERHGDDEALHRMIGAAGALGRWDEAEQLLGELRALGDDERWMLETLDLRRRARAWPELLRFVGDNRPQIVASRRLLRRAVTALNAGGQMQASLDLIAGAEQKQFTRALTVETHLHSGQLGPAWSAYRRPPGMGKVPVSLVRPLVSAALQSEGMQAARGLVDALPGIFPLIGTYERMRLDAIDALAGSQPQLVDDRPRRQAAVAGAAARFDRSHPEKAEWLHWFAEGYERSAGFAPDPDTSLADAIAVAERIMEAVRSCEALSLLRLGDGEGNVLPYRAAYRGLQRLDGAQVTWAWWGEDMLTHPRWGEATAALQSAIANATIVGVPDLMRVLRSGIPRDIRGLSPGGPQFRGLCAVLDAVRATETPGRFVTSCHVHQALAHWGLWDVILRQCGAVSLVTCHPGLADALRGRFGTEIDAVHVIPGESKYAARFEGRMEGRHFPDVFDAVSARLDETPPGRVVLVAAGMLGKIYCERVRQAGGIAIDVGSAADYWSGHATRTPEENSAYTPVPRVQEQLEALALLDPRVARLLDGGMPPIGAGA